MRPFESRALPTQRKAAGECFGGPADEGFAGRGCYDFTRRLGMKRDRLRDVVGRKQSDLRARAMPLFEKRDRLMQERVLLDARLEQFHQALEQAKGAGQ